MFNLSASSLVLFPLLLLLLSVGRTGLAGEPFLRVQPQEESARGISVVLISGDEEYRSEEALPLLAQLLACHHGLSCTVLFAIDPESGQIDPNNQENIPGLKALADADLMIIATRFRNLPDEQMSLIDEYVRSGRPVIGLRTATHAFRLGEASSFAHYTWNAPVETDHPTGGGFGRWLLGETWIAHHGAHGTQSTLGEVAPDAADHPIARGLGDQVIWGPTDVYAVRLPLPEHSQTIANGRVLDGMTPDAPAATGEKNEPMMPVAWTRELPMAVGGIRRVFTTTMGAATDLEARGTRTMLINAVFWALGLEDEIPADGCESELIGEYVPSAFGFGAFQRGRVPEDYDRACD